MIYMKFPNMWDPKNRKKKNAPKQTITQDKDLRDPVIWLYPWNCKDFTIYKEKYKIQQYNLKKNAIHV